MVFDVNVRKRFQGGPGVGAEHDEYKWWALSCTSLGMLLVATNSGTLIIALPELERSLGTSLLQLVWVILAYMISSTVLVLTAGRLSGTFSAERRPTSPDLWFSPLPRSAPASPPTAVSSLPGASCREWRRLPLCQRRGTGHRCLPRGSSSASRWRQARWLPQSGSCSDRCSAADSLRSPGTGFSGLTCRLPWREPSGKDRPARVPPARMPVRGLDLLGTLTFVIGLYRPRLPTLRGGISGWRGAGR